MKKILFLSFVILALTGISIYANQPEDYLVKIQVSNQNEINQLLRERIPVIQEFSDQVIAKLNNQEMSLLSGKNYAVLDKIDFQKAYYLILPMNSFVAEQIRSQYDVITEGNPAEGAYLLIVTSIDKVHDLAHMPIMLTQIDFTPVTLSVTAPDYPELTFNPLVQQMVQSVSSDSVLASVQRLQDFRNRYSTSDSNMAAVNWIRNRFIAYGCDSVFTHSFSTTYKPNIIGVKRGFTYPDNIYYVICGHLDAVSNCPGADDNASGTTAVLEACRVMQDMNFEYSIRYIGFNAEEQGLIGSNAYAQMARNAGDSILGVFNFDMIGYADIHPEDLEVIGKISNPNCSSFVNHIISSAATYVPELQTNRRMVTSLSGSDHHSFWQRGYVGFCGIEDYPLTNPYYHLPSDTIGSGFNSLSFCTKVIKTGVASLASLANPIFPNQPLVVYRSYRITEINGNNNNRWDAAESVNLYITLRNIGQITANAVSATISTVSPYVSIIQNQAGFGNIGALDTSVNTTPYVVYALPSTPIAHNANFNLTVTSTDTTWHYTFSIPIGQFATTDPIPDGPRSPSLYWAYDNTDLMYGQHPVYNWREIKNIGTRLLFDHNDQVRVVPLPTAFGSIKFYGQNYSSISISVDGFITLGSDTTRAYTNHPIPSPNGPAAMIAVNWDDLLHSNTTNVGGIYWYYDSLIKAMIVEWDSVSYYSVSVRDKFQAIIFDSTYTTSSGDNIIIAQYMTANRFTSSTIGIEDPTQTIGIQYLFDGNYHPAAAPIQPQRAIKFVTNSPMGIVSSEIPSIPQARNHSITISPNPFKNQTTICLTSPLSNTDKPLIRIYNSSGRLIKSFSTAQAIWDGRDQIGKKVGAGVYFVKTESEIKPTKIIYLR
ncbi:MAG: M28 family peptidase [Candidatus Latescibacteria bacterium]|nr:M28 family peptidase [Candidatus Latescibacterota bacterium]